jgi:hypothetical protein
MKINYRTELCKAETEKIIYLRIDEDFKLQTDDFV